MTSAETVAMYITMAAAFPDAVVSLVVSVDSNNTVTTTGLRGNENILRAVTRGGLADNVDVGVWVLKSAFAGYDISALRGRTATVTYKTQDAVTMRITGTREHACGGLVHLQFGEYDRVVQ